MMYIPCYYHYHLFYVPLETLRRQSADTAHSAMFLFYFFIFHLANTVLVQYESQKTTYIFVSRTSYFCQVILLTDENNVGFFADTSNSEFSAWLRNKNRCSFVIWIFECGSIDEVRYKIRIALSIIYKQTHNFNCVYLTVKVFSHVTITQKPLNSGIPI